MQNCILTESRLERERERERERETGRLTELYYTRIKVSARTEGDSLIAVRSQHEGWEKRGGREDLYFCIRGPPPHHGVPRRNIACGWLNFNIIPPPADSNSDTAGRHFPRDVLSIPLRLFDNAVVRSPLR